MEFPEQDYELVKILFNVLETTSASLITHQAFSTRYAALFDMSFVGTKGCPVSSKRGRSRSLSSCEQITRVDDDLLARKWPPLSGHDLDKFNHHVCLQDFGSRLQRAANAIFPGDQISRYTEVHVILLSWEDEDPNLPVSLEIETLADVFSNLYGFEVEQWLIPSDNSHNKLNKKILNFLGDDDASHLKIVFYAGHGKLTNHGTPAWTRCV
jgi:hypothetical protein